MAKGIILTTCSILIAFAAIAAKVETSTLRQLANIKITTFNHQLRTTLQSNIELGTLKKHLNGCGHIEQNLMIQNSTGGWQIARTSLKVRNPSNAPDSWEYAQLTAFQSAYQKGKTIDKLSVERLSTVGPNKVVYKYMKGIEAEAICLNCHGVNLSKEVKQNLAIHYPDDQATGYQVGDLMGAFVLQKVVNAK